MSLEEYFVQQLNNDPRLIYVVGVIFIVLFLLAFYQGRRLKIPMLEIGEKPQPLPSPINIYPPGSAELSEEKKREIVDEIMVKIKEERKKSRFEDDKLIYKPAEMPKRTHYVFAAKTEIENKIRELTISHFGGFAGVSMAPAEIFLEMGVREDLISKELEIGISEFYWLITPGIFGEVIYDELFLDIQYMATKINRELDKIPLLGESA